MTTSYEWKNFCQLKFLHVIYKKKCPPPIRHDNYWGDHRRDGKKTAARLKTSREIVLTNLPRVVKNVKMRSSHINSWYVRRNAILKSFEIGNIFLNLSLVFSKNEYLYTQCITWKSNKLQKKCSDSALQFLKRWLEVLWNWKHFHKAVVSFL